MARVRKPLVSVVIPTRERAETLKFALETALDQATNNYEIVVSDNYSKDNTKEIVRSFSDARIKYVNTARRLSMCDNWDFAILHAAGKYIIIIGDDDGVMPGAIDRLERIIKTNPSRIYRWEIPEYFWPIDYAAPAIGHIPSITRPHEIDLRRQVKFAIKWGTWRYGTVPLLYHSAVSKQILANIRERTGRVFHSLNPDVFMAFALPVFSNKALDVGESITVSGMSAKSLAARAVAANGAATLERSVQEYGDYKIHASLLPDAPFAVNSYADSALVAMELFPDYYGDMKFNYSAMWAHMQRILGFASVMSIARNRRRINQYHPFSVSRFLLYSVVHKALSIRIALRRRLANWRFESISGQVPKNIRDFVRVLDEQRTN